MGLILLLTWVVFTVFGVTSTQKVSKNFRYSHNSFIGDILTPQYLGWLLKKSSLNSQFLELK